MASAAGRVGRDPNSIQLVAVTKTVSVLAIQEVVRAGVKDLGESRVQEAKGKVSEMGDAVTWHLVGHLQTNKVRDAVQLFGFIHSVDRWELAQKLSQEAEKQGKQVQGLLQVNAAKESTKGGFFVEEVPEAIQKISVLPGLSLLGLMTIAPYSDDPETVRPIFRAMKSLFDRLPICNSKLLTVNSWSCLSMGMSNDFEVAIEEGATLVRVGSAIFGERNQEREVNRGNSI